MAAFEESIGLYLVSIIAVSINAVISFKMIYNAYKEYKLHKKFSINNIVLIMYIIVIPIVKGGVSIGESTQTTELHFESISEIINAYNVVFVWSICMNVIDTIIILMLNAILNCFCISYFVSINRNDTYELDV